jgi:hypothetical protein
MASAAAATLVRPVKWAKAIVDAPKSAAASVPGRRKGSGGGKPLSAGDDQLFEV